jgi:glycosyltransferase involved in cell wall biosynthesis
MITVILGLVSGVADITEYNKLLGDGDALVVLRCDELSDGQSIVELYNEVVSGVDKGSDVLLLSGDIILHAGFFDNLRSCLFAAEKHGIVYGQEIEDKESLIETARKYLPEYTLTVQANPCCALIKSTVINTLGFLDASYKGLDFALMDYYCRINKYGFSSVISHHSLYTHREGARHDTALEADRELFASRYEYWEERKQRHALHGNHACINFLTLLDQKYYPKKRILFDCIIMPAMHCGTSEYQIAVFDAFYRLFKDRYDIFLFTNHEADEFHGLSEKYENVVFPETISGTFHLGYTPNQLMFYGPQVTMSKHCLKIVQTMFDIMVVRIDEHVLIDVNSDVELGIRSSDGIIFISEYTKNDFMACFANESGIKEKLLKVIYPATGLGISEKNDYDLPFEEYFLVVGNTYKHKAIEEAIEAVSGTKHCFIIVGSGDNEHIHPNVYGYKSGYLDDDFLSYLYTKCKAVIFPSLYEGFGLPVAIGLRANKRIIVNRNALNNELIGHFHQFKDHFLLFDRFEQIREIVENTDFSSNLTSFTYDDSWDRVATELEAFFDDILKTDVEIDRLNKRWHLYGLIEGKLIGPRQLIDSQNKEILSLHHKMEDLKRVVEGNFSEYGLFSLLAAWLEERIKIKLPRLFKFLKRLRKSVKAM